MSGELIPVAKREDVIALDKAAKETQRELMEARESQNDFAMALIAANGLRRIREALTPALMQDMMGLMNSPLGFITDRGPHAKREDYRKPYTVEEVRDCMIQAIAWGVRPVGNELNILAGRPYRTKEHWERKVKTFPGLTEFKERFGLPDVKDGVCRVACVCQWKLNGQPGSYAAAQSKSTGEDWRIVVRADGGSADTLLGKAKARAYKAVYAILVGSPVDGDDDDNVDPNAGVDEAEVVARDIRKQSASNPTVPGDDSGADIVAIAEKVFSRCTTQEELDNRAHDYESHQLTPEQVKRLTAAYGARKAQLQKGQQ